MIGTAGHSETSVQIYHTTRCKIPESSTHHIYRSKNCQYRYSSLKISLFTTQYSWFNQPDVKKNMGCVPVLRDFKSAQFNTMATLLFQLCSSNCCIATPLATLPFQPFSHCISFCLCVCLEGNEWNSIIPNSV
jgi:hypothetical protein